TRHMFARFFRNRTAGVRENARRRPSANRVALRVEALEERELMAGGLADLVRADISNVFLDGSIVFAPQPPALSSNPGAAHTLYLDFNGHFEPTWSSDGMSFTNVVTQVFSTDNDLTSF